MLKKRIYACLHSWPRKKEVTLGDIIEPELRTKTPSSSVQRSPQKAHLCNLRVAIIGNQGQVLRVHCPAPDAGNE